MISADVGLSYRLIRFINSPYFGLRNKISSISHAISLMGQLALRQWLMAVTLSSAVESDQGKEIYFLCIKRARFLEQLAEKSTKVKAKGDSLFLLGLFSKLDVLLCQDMRVLVRELNLDEQISRALCGEKTPYYDFLALAEGLEHAQWDSLTPTMKQLGLGVSDVAITNNMAILWATELLSATPGKLNFRQGDPHARRSANIVPGRMADFRSRAVGPCGARSGLWYLAAARRKRPKPSTPAMESAGVALTPLDMIEPAPQRGQRDISRLQKAVEILRQAPVSPKPPGAIHRT